MLERLQLSRLQLIKLLKNTILHGNDTRGRALSTSTASFSTEEIVEEQAGGIFVGNGVEEKRMILIKHHIAICYTAITPSLSLHPRHNIYNAINYEVR